jgi:uncharacterized protein involved in type VI secretion and phage assembly
MPVTSNEKSGNQLPRSDIQPIQGTSSTLSTAQPPIESVPATRWYGVYPATVRDNDDPENLGRVKVLLVWAPDSAGIVGLEKGQQYEGWARLTTFMAGQNRGAWFIPEINDEVLVAFEGGHPGRPFVVGSLWNGQDIPPAAMDSQRENNVKLLKSRAGIEIKINDKAGDEYIQIQTPGGRRIKLTDYSKGSIKIEDNGGNSIELKNAGITISSSATVRIDASKIELNAAMVDVKSGMTKFSGVVQSDTVITNSVVASSYTPGAGNIW